MSRKIILILGISIGWLTSGVISVTQAQNASDAMRYSMQYPGGGVASTAMPGSGLTTGMGLGSTIDNPASAALFENSGTFLGFSLRNVSETGTYLGSSVESSENHNSLSNIGFAYSMPTTRGSFVFGAGYVQTTDFDRSLEVSAYNERNTITDMYNQSGFYGDAAYEAFAIDSVDNRTQSIFRFNGFEGVEQQMQMLESGRMGELTGFLATEYQKNLFLGVSLNIPTGSYTYERTFIERDSRDLYTEFPYDVDNVFSMDEINADISGFRARVGMIYKISDLANIGVNYQFRSTLNVDEEYSTLIETAFDEGDPYSSDFTGEVRYKVESPARLSAGIAFKKVDDLMVTLAAERIDYGGMRMEARANNSQLSGYFLDINNNIRDDYNSVINLEGGVSYQINPMVRPYAGYAFYPSPLDDDADKRLISGGVNLGMQEQLNLNLGIQYAMWEDRLVLYDFVDSSDNLIAEAAHEDVGRLQVIIGLSYRF